MEMEKPSWLEGLVGETFFTECGTHQRRRKNEKNIFCLDCCESICQNCLTSHRSHPLIQVRRYVYHDVVRLQDLKKLIDCSFVQSYTVNNAKVVFLKQRPQSRPSKGSANMCFTCDRILQEPFHFCSLSCKVDYFVSQEDLSSILCKFDESDFAVSQFEGLRVDGSDLIDDDAQITPNSILEDSLEFNKGYSCSSSRANSDVSEDSDVVKNGSGFLSQIMCPLSRRKGLPHRSPLS
ncbi:PLATZ transcription factor family protein [Tasmannia lanceolata]|uniref:PLATZ transcription factor family protein n=1 Tax=Tasmannia lanceolata TaxID=3420 RepID=UPI0040648E0F